MAEYIEYQHNKDKRKRKGVCKQLDIDYDLWNAPYKKGTEE